MTGLYIWPKCHTMTHEHLVAHIYRLWPSIAEMSRDTGLPVVHLLAQRERGELPDAVADPAILDRAVQLGHAQITAEALREVRAGGRLDLPARREVIGAFFEACGGTDVVGRRLRMTPAALRTSKSRGWISARHKYEAMGLAVEQRITLPPEVFEPPRA